MPSDPQAERAVIEASGLSKSYALWGSPSARLRSAALSHAAGLPLVPPAWRAGLRRAAGRERIDFQALQDVSFSLERGETLAVIGRNGSGKSTLLQILAGTLAPSAGSARVRGRVAALLELGSGFHPDFSGRENVRLNAALLGLEPQELEARFDAIAAFADIGAFLEQPLRTYSSGMLLRLAFAVAAHAAPDVLIVDEALAVGDAGFQFKCLERIRRLVEGGTTLLFVSHDMLTVKAFCRRALYLEAGRAKALGDVETVAEQYFLDLRNEQRRSASVAGGLEPRPSLRPGAPPSFGAADGRILDVRFAATRAKSAAFARGEHVSIEAELELEAGLAAPSATLLLLSDRLIPVAGRRLALEPAREKSRYRLRWAFPARLGPGRYYVTLRFEQGPSPAGALLIEKQTAALELDVLADGDAALLGLFDLGIRAESQREAAAAEPAARAAG